MRARRAERQHRVDVPAPLRRGERVRRDARPRGGRVPARAAGPQGPQRPALRPGHEHPRDDLGHEDRLDHRPRRPARRPVASHPGSLEDPPPLPHRLRRRARPPAHDALRQRDGRDAPGVRARAGLRHAAGHLGVHRHRLQRREGDVGRQRRRDGPHDRPQPRLRGVARPRPPDDARRRHRVLRADVEQRAGAPGLRRGLQARRAHRGLLARVARARRLPRPPVAAVPAAVRADAEGAVVRAHRRDGRRGHDLPAGDAARRAQLGLPLLVDPRLHVHALGPLHARLRLGGQRLLLLHRRRRRQRARPPDHVRDRWRAPAGGIGARPPRRLRGREAGPDRQRRLRAPPARRLGDDPRLVLPAHEVARRPARPLLADPVQAGGDGDHALARAGPRHLGGARRAQALHVLQGHVLGGLRPRRAPGADARRARPGRALAGGGGRDPRRRPRARHRRARRLRAALRDHGARRLAPAAAPRAVPAARGRRASAPP